MKRTTSASIAVLVAATIALGAAAPALAQGPGFHGQRGELAFRMDRDGHRMFARGQMRGEARGGILGLVCAERGADRLEHMLLSISQRAAPTGDQVALYDAFKDAAMSAQTDFAAACQAARPADATAPANPVERMKTRLAVEEARLAAMSDVLPTFEAFYDSLSDEQQQAFALRGNDDRRGFRKDRMRGPGMNRPAAPSAN